MFDFIMPPLVVGIVCLGIYGLFELFVRKKERLAIIEKLSELSDKDLPINELRLPSYSFPRLSFSSLKIGCLLAGLGLGFLVGFFLDLNVAAIRDEVKMYNEYRSLEAAYGASVLLFAGLGLIVAFIIENKMKKKNPE